MSKHTLQHGLQANIEQMFAALPDIEALRLFEKLAERFSFSYGHDAISEGIDHVASDLGDDLGYADAATILEPHYSNNGVWF